MERKERKQEREGARKDLWSGWDLGLARADAKLSLANGFRRGIFTTPPVTQPALSFQDGPSAHELALAVISVLIFRQCLLRFDSLWPGEAGTVQMHLMNRPHRNQTF